MDKLNNDINFKIGFIKERLKYLENNYNGDFKKFLLLYDDIINNLDDITISLDNFEINQENNIYLDNELSERIESNNKVNNIIKIFSPFMLLYQISNLNT